MAILFFKLYENFLNTFLPLVEDRRAWMVDTVFILVLIRLPATFVNTLLGHCASKSDTGTFKNGYKELTKRYTGASANVCNAAWSNDLSDRGEYSGIHERGEWRH